MVVFGEWKSLPMEPLKEELIRKGVAKEESVKVLDRAAVRSNDPCFNSF